FVRDVIPILLQRSAPVDTPIAWRVRGLPSQRPAAIPAHKSLVFVCFVGEVSYWKRSTANGRRWGQYPARGYRRGGGVLCFTGALQQEHWQHPQRRWGRRGGVSALRKGVVDPWKHAIWWRS